MKCVARNRRAREWYQGFYAKPSICCQVIFPLINYFPVRVPICHFAADATPSEKGDRARRGSGSGRCMGLLSLITSRSSSKTSGGRGGVTGLDWAIGRLAGLRALEIENEEGDSQTRGHRQGEGGGLRDTIQRPDPVPTFRNQNITHSCRFAGR